MIRTEDPPKPPPPPSSLHHPLLYPPSTLSTLPTLRSVLPLIYLIHLSFVGMFADQVMGSLLRLGCRLRVNQPETTTCNISTHSREASTSQL